MKRIKLSDSVFEPREGYERSVLFTADDFAGDTKLQLMRLAPNQCVKSHYHNARTECFRIVSGEGQIKIQGEIVASSNDDLVLCNPGEVHEFINTSTTEPFVVLVVRTNDPGGSDMIWLDK